MANLRIGQCRKGRLLAEHLVTARADGGSFSDLDPNAVFRLFHLPVFGSPAFSGRNIHREIDMLEVLRGGSSNAQFTLQPFDPPPIHGIHLPCPEYPVITIVNDWVESTRASSSRPFLPFSGRLLA